MKLKVVVENNTYIDKYYLGEPALSIYIENEGDRILFDMGYSEAFIKNAEKMNIDLNSVNKIVFSHGHSDHTGGIKYFDEAYGLEGREIFACKGCFEKKFSQEGYIGAPFSEKELKMKKASLNVIEKPFEISKNLIFIGPVPEYFDFEKRYSIGVNENGEKDYITEDSAMVYKTPKGIFVITGCSHSGICNIIEYAQKLCDETRVLGVIGGFHMFDENERLKKTIEFFEKKNIKNIYPCHCVSFKAKCAMNSRLNVGDVAVGFEMEI